MPDDLNVTLINSKSSGASAAYMLKYDSVHGTFPADVSFKNHTLQVGGRKIAYQSHAHPKNIPWDKWGVDVVLECTGAFKTTKDLKAHFKKGVKMVFTAYPLPNCDFTVIYGINHKLYKKNHKIVSNGSCTTNCLAPLIKVLHNAFRIKELLFTTVHSYTLDQKLLDSSHKDLRRSRAGGLSIIPTSTGATQTLTKIFPDLKNKINGMALRVPTPNVSLVDIVFYSHKPPSISTIHQALKHAQNNDLKNILHLEYQPLVSVDFNGSPYSCVVDMPSIMTTKTNTQKNTRKNNTIAMTKILAWYDNETGFSQRMIDFLHFLTSKY